MEYRSLVLNIMFAALISTSAFSMHNHQCDSQPSILPVAKKEPTWATLQGEGYSLKVPLKTAKVSKVFEKEILKSLKTYDSKQGEFLIKVPAQIAGKTLLKMITLMNKIVDLQEKEEPESNFILSIYKEIFRDMWANEKKYVDVILAAKDLGCSFIFEALLLAFKQEAPIESKIKSFQYVRVLDEIRAEYSAKRSDDTVSKDGVDDNDCDSEGEHGACVCSSSFVSQSLGTSSPTSSSSSSSSSSGDVIKKVILQGDGYTLDIPIEVAMVSQAIKRYVENSKNPQGESVTIKIPSNISKVNLSKMLEFMTLVVEVQQESSNEVIIISEIFGKTWLHIKENLDLILAADYLDCPYIVKALTLAFKEKAPTGPNLKSFDFVSALSEVKASHLFMSSSICSSSVVDVDDFAPLVQAMAQTKISDFEKSNVPWQLCVRLKSGELINLDEAKTKSKTLYFGNTLIVEAREKNKAFSFEQFDDDAVRCVCSIINLPDTDNAETKRKKILDAFGSTRAKADVWAMADYLGYKELVDAIQPKMVSYFCSPEFFAWYKGDIIPNSQLFQKDIYLRVRPKHLFLLHDYADGYDQFPDHGISCVAFSPDSKLLVTSSLGVKKTKIWETKTGKCIKTWLHNCSCLAFSPTGDTIAVAPNAGSATNNFESEAKLYNLQSEKVFILSAIGVACVTSISFSPDGKIVATAHHGGKLKLWNTKTGECILETPQLGWHLWGVVFSPDGRVLAVNAYCAELNNGVELDYAEALRTRNYNGIVGYRYVAKLLNVETGQCIFRLPHDMTKDCHNYVSTVMFNPTGKRLATVVDNQKINIWNSENGQLIQTLVHNTDNYDYYSGRVFSIAFCPWDENLLATGVGDGTVKLWNIETGKCIHTWTDNKGHFVFSTSVAFCRDGRLFMGWPFFNAKGDYANFEDLGINSSHSCGVFPITISPDNNLVATPNLYGMVDLWDIDFIRKLTSGLSVEQLILFINLQRRSAQKRFPLSSAWRKVFETLPQDVKQNRN